MPSLNHKDFIISPLMNILRDVVYSIDCLGDGMEFYAASGNILHSLFLQLTGAQEQKMKCICWDLATYDYEYRYNRYSPWNLGECSRLKDKNVVFGDLVKAVRKLNPNYKVFGSGDNEKRQFIKDVINRERSILENSNLSKAYVHQYEEYRIFFDTLDPKNIAAGDQQIFTGSDEDNFESLPDANKMNAIYSLLYKHRNRCAHNLLSYQQNLPTFQELNDTFTQKYYNIFIFISILILIDELFIRVYKKYSKVIVEA